MSSPATVGDGRARVGWWQGGGAEKEARGWQEGGGRKKVFNRGEGWVDRGVEVGS